ncbi:MAG: polysaccharide biosynthesis C-terminal domain-containing protein, partial [Clostridia bacterium]|nr:polysaccharide biosynthesis C-terminal domain-containing protein [Clostridia bacterium]
PAVAAAKSNKERRAKIRRSLLSTLAIYFPCAVGLFLLAGYAQRLIFPSLSLSDGETLVRLVRLFSISTVTLACTQTLSACLTATGKPLYATLSMGIAMGIKTLLNFWWVQNPRFSVYGAAMATNIGYLVAFLLDLYYNIKVTKSRAETKVIRAEKRSKHGSRRWFRGKRRGLD